MAYTETADLTTPIGGDPAVNVVSDIIQAKRIFVERWEDVTGCDADVDPNVPVKYGTKVNINTSQVRGSSEYDNGNSGTSKTVSFDNGNYQKLAMTGNCTITLSNIRATATMLLRTTSSTGFTITWPAAVKWGGGIVPTPAGVMVYYLYSPDGTTVYASAAITNAS